MKGELRPRAARRTDRYLDALALGADRGAGDVPAPSELDPEIRSAALRLRDELVRVHPSFRFEERLSARLAEAATSMPETRAAVVALLPMPGGSQSDAEPVAGGEAAAASIGRLPGPLALIPRYHRVGFIAAGILASALVSLGAGLLGTGWLVRRRARTGTPRETA